jgi:glycosyltransferase involved in cell wall biosynthesis
MMKRGILILGNYPPPYGGLPRHLELLVPYLVQKNWDVHVLARGSTGTERGSGLTIYKPRKKERSSSISKCGTALRLTAMIRLYSAFLWARKQWEVYLGLIATGSQIIENNKIDLISAYNLVLNGPIGAVLSEKYHIPLVMTNLGEIYSENMYVKQHISIIKYVCNKVRIFLSPSKHCADSYHLLGIFPKVNVISHGTDIQRFNQSENGMALRAKLNMSDNDKVCLFVGRMIKDMGLHTLLHAIPPTLERKPEVKFIIVGQDGELFPAAEELARRYEKRMHVFPNVPFDALASFYAAASVVVAPTEGHRACGSLAAMEAMATGKAVIAANVGGIPELVVDGQTGCLVAANDPEGLAKAIVDLLFKDALRARMGSQGRKRIEEFFDKDITNRKTEELFSNAIRV